MPCARHYLWHDRISIMTMSSGNLSLSICQHLDGTIGIHWKCLCMFTSRPVTILNQAVTIANQHRQHRAKGEEDYQNILPFCHVRYFIDLMNRCEYLNKRLFEHTIQGRGTVHYITRILLFSNDLRVTLYKFHNVCPFWFPPEVAICDGCSWLHSGKSWSTCCLSILGDLYWGSMRLWDSISFIMGLNFVPINVIGHQMFMCLSVTFLGGEEVSVNIQ